MKDVNRNIDKQIQKTNMNKTLGILIISLLTIGSKAISQVKWNCDKVHSSVKFTVRYLGISNVSGTFDAFEGSITSAKEDLTDATIEFRIEANSINTGISARDNHLRSADFFDVAKFPSLSFRSTSFRKQGKDKYKLEGDMTIRGVTKRMTFTATYGGIAKDNYGNERAGFTLTDKVKRSAFSINGGKGIVGDEVTFNLDLNFIRQK